MQSKYMAHCLDIKSNPVVQHTKKNKAHRFSIKSNPVVQQNNTHFHWLRNGEPVGHALQWFLTIKMVLRFWRSNFAWREIM